MSMHPSTSSYINPLDVLEEGCKRRNNFYLSLFIFKIKPEKYVYK